MPPDSDGGPSSSTSSPNTSASTATNARALLGARGLRPKKRLGQSFLMDDGIVRRIAALAVDAPGERVVEIGAGTGTLTAALAARGADLTAFDLDPDLVAILRSRTDLGGAIIECADALRFDYAAWAGTGRWRAAGNLPYNVATPLLIRLAQLEHPPERVVAMIQKDVADRLLARPSTAAYGSLTLAIGLTMGVERAFNVGPAQFFPRPNVVSSVVVLRRLEHPAADVADRGWFEQVVRGAFAYRRKTLVNSLALALEIPRERIASALHDLALDADIRGEALDLPTFAALADALAA
jgi:16S rRNA (adenine1518-N6/adenine1519-N6)-dimethyltransferase